MTISSTTARMDYTGNGATATYSYTFKIFEDSDLEVISRDTDDAETTLVLTTDYTVTGAGDASGGSITLVAGNLTSNFHLTIKRMRPLTQTTDIRNQGEFFPEIHEDEFDHLIMIDQQQQDQLDRSVYIPASVSDFDGALPSNIADSAGSALIVNDDGDGFIFGVNTLGTDTSRVAKPAYSFAIPTAQPTTNKVFKYNGSSYVWGDGNGSGTAKSADYTVLDSDGIYVVLMTTGASNRTVTLPTAADNTGRVIGVKKVDSGAGKCTVDGEGSEAIDGALTFILSSQYDAILLQCDGSNWFKIASHFANNSRVRVETGNGFGSSSTKIRRFVTTVVNTGTAITYADSATLGGTFTINEPGIYNMTYTDEKVGGISSIGISLNSAQLTTSILSITNTARLAFANAGSGVFAMISATVRLSATDVIRPHTDGTQDDVTAGGSSFSISKIGF